MVSLLWTLSLRGVVAMPLEGVAVYRERDGVNDGGGIGGDPAFWTVNFGSYRYGYRQHPVSLVWL